MMEQREEVQRQEKARRVRNDDNNNALRPPTMAMTMTMPTMTMLCQYLPFLLAFFVWLIVMG
jgi:hypothetical protein